MQLPWYSAAVAEAAPHIVGRYAIFDEIASGGMATVHIGRLVGPVGFSRTVAIKRLHPQFAKDPEFVSMFVDEARLAARIRHPNVVPTLDVVKTEDELFLVLDYVQGESLSRLMRYARRRGTTIPPRLVVPVVAGMLHGLHAAHSARGERGQPLHIVHRDVSPQNVLVGSDGVPRVFDFGIAKARGRLQTTREGQIKGKLAYMAPEQLRGEVVGVGADIYSAAVVLWEALAGRRLFEADNEAALFGQVLAGPTYPPSAFNPQIASDLDHITMIGLAPDPANRFSSARAMAAALERAVQGASPTEIGDWVDDVANETLQRRADRVAEIESKSEIKMLGDAMISPSRPSMASVSGEQSVHSQLSSISVARAELPLRRRSMTLPLIAGLVALVVGGIAALAWLGPTRFTTNEQAGPTRAEEEPTAESDEPKDEPKAVAAPSATPSVATSSTPTASAVVPVPRVVSVPRARPGPRPSPPPTTKPNCNPPYSVDADGIRHPKPECL